MTARYIVKFNKGYGVKFISHLDLMRCIQRTVRRAGIPISYSKGFNPHSEISFATPLSVGTSSTGEYLDIKLDEGLDSELLMNRMNEMLPGDIRITAVREVDEKFPSLMAVVEGASYEITLANVARDSLEEDFIDRFMDMESIEVKKSGKKGDRIIDIKPMIDRLELKRYDNDSIVLGTMVSAGSRANLNPELIAEGLKMYIGGFSNANIRDIKKIETFVKKDGEFLTPIEL